MTLLIYAMDDTFAACLDRRVGGGVLCIELAWR